MESSPLEIMTPFLLGGAVLLLIAVLRGWRVHDRGVDVTIAIFFIFAAAIIAGVMQLGTDAPSYRDEFNGLAFSHAQGSWWEPGFEYLALAFAVVGAPYGVFVFVLVLVTHFLELRVYSRTSVNVTLAFFVLFCFNLGDIPFVREDLAASILLVAFYLLQRRHILWGVIVIVCATLIHKTALPVGLLLLFVSYGIKAIRPLLYLALLMTLVYLILPPQVTQAISQRILDQIFDYTAREFVQGLVAKETSLFRNLAKFFVYGLLAVWMLMVPVRNSSELLQAKAAQAVLAVSAVSVALILLISPVFARLSTYIFPFLAIAMRTERFSPKYSELPVQIAAVTILLANLFIALYPVVQYL